MAKKISEERKSAYYIGMGLTVVGVLLFASTFVTFAMRFGDFSNFESNAKSEMFRALGGMALMIVGGIISGIGAGGLAGSGVVLDPDKARQDLEPYSRMAGGMLKDALEEANVNLGGRPEKVIMIKCPSCGRLNGEDAKFCQECGKKT
jgi:F0F1-type ATP synthase membrane subunit c/vacuolar-type H+-ATPase subunit K